MRQGAIADLEQQFFEHMLVLHDFGQIVHVKVVLLGKNQRILEKVCQSCGVVVALSDRVESVRRVEPVVLGVSKDR